MSKKIAIIASLLGALTIALGAFGSHGLKSLVSIESQKIFETGVRYQMYHVFALLFLSVIPIFSQKIKFNIARLFLLGVLLFSGSLYGLAFKEILPFSVSILGPITPIGGLCFIVGWALLAYYLIKEKS